MSTLGKKILTYHVISLLSDMDGARLFLLCCAKPSHFKAKETDVAVILTNILEMPAGPGVTA